MNERFATSVGNEKVRHDMGVVADFIKIFCDAHHRDAERGCINTDATGLGVYGAKPPVLCAACEAHLAYAEKRRAYCTKDPKPFCAHCDSQCYSSEELAWEGEMMRYSGPRSWYRGHAIDGIRHALEGAAARRELKRNATAESD